jgi:hypothetical protein
VTRYSTPNCSLIKPAKRGAESGLERRVIESRPNSAKNPCAGQNFRGPRIRIPCFPTGDGGRDGFRHCAHCIGAAPVQGRPRVLRPRATPPRDVRADGPPLSVRKWRRLESLEPPTSGARKRRRVYHGASCALEGPRFAARKACARRARSNQVETPHFLPVILLISACSVSHASLLFRPLASGCIAGAPSTRKSFNRS